MFMRAKRPAAVIPIPRGGQWDGPGLSVSPPGKKWPQERQIALSKSQSSSLRKQAANQPQMRIIQHNPAYLRFQDDLTISKHIPGRVWAKRIQKNIWIRKISSWIRFGYEKLSKKNVFQCTWIHWRILRYGKIFSYPDPDLNSPCPYLSGTMLRYAHIQPYPKIRWRS